MELITILNRCHRFRGLSTSTPIQCRQEEYRSGRATPQGFGRSLLARCHLPPPGYAERRFEFISLWGFLVFLLCTMPRVNCRRCGIVAVEEVPWGDGKRTLTKAYMLFLARWARR
jgi:transposase